MLVRRSSSDLLGFTMLIFSIEFHAVLWALEKQTVFVLVLLEVSRHVMCLKFVLETLCLS